METCGIFGKDKDNIQILLYLPKNLPTMTKDTSNVTEVYGSLREQCKRAGVSLRYACERAGIPYDAVTKWKRKTPKSIDTLYTLEKAIESIKQENA
jgi:nitrate/TMAO reductase-like tetraheme cytochrome c subunit